MTQIKQFIFVPKFYSDIWTRVFEQTNYALWTKQYNWFRPYGSFGELLYLQWQKKL